jgi:hypothetical protein
LKEIQIDERTELTLHTLKVLTLEAYRQDGMAEEDIERLNQFFTENSIIYMAADALIEVFRRKLKGELQ